MSEASRIHTLMNKYFRHIGMKASAIVTSKRYIFCFFCSTEFDEILQPPSKPCLQDIEIKSAEIRSNISGV
jgi:hypothetical protein